MTKKKENLCRDVYSISIHKCQNLEQSRCPSVGEWLHKQGCIQIVGYHSVLKRNELSSQEKIWTDLKGILVSEGSQSEKEHPVWLQLYDILEKAPLWRE